MKPCHYVKHKGERYFIPGCMGGVHHGKEGCHCNSGKMERDRIEALEKRIEKLEKLLNKV
jgi:CO dehydrogenase nickel-insertion accessory protein CooC1